MASPSSFLSFGSTSVLLLLLTFFPNNAFSQNLGNSPSGPTIAGCGPSLLPLVSCAPFVQGRVPSPIQQCCDNVDQLYYQQPSCLCLLLNDNALRSLPINRTLALQLPLLCNLQVDISTCSGVTLPPNPPAEQVSFGTKANSTVADSPSFTVAPTPNNMGFRFQQSASGKIRVGVHLIVVVAATVVAFLWTNSLL